MSFDPRKILEALPDGRTIPFQDFAAAVDHPIAKVLPFGKGHTIKRTRNQVSIDSGQKVRHQAKDLYLELGPLTEFYLDIDMSAHDVVLSNIKGIAASYSGSPMVDLVHLSFHRLDNGNVRITARAKVSRWLPAITISKEVRPDGKPA